MSHNTLANPLPPLTLNAVFEPREKIVADDSRVIDEGEVMWVAGDAEAVGEEEEVGLHVAQPAGGIVQQEERHLLTFRKS